MGATEAETMLAGLVRNIFGKTKFKFHRTDPTTSKRETVK